MTPERLAFAKLRVARLTAKLDAHNVTIRTIAGMPGTYTQDDLDRAMKARRSTIATRKRWLKEIAAHGAEHN